MFLAGFGFRFRHNGRHAGHDLDVVGLASIGRQASLEIVVKGLRFLECLGRREHHVGGAGGKVAADIRGAGLDHHRCTLRRTRQVERVANRKALAVMPGSAAVPKPCDHLGELTGALIAVGMGLEAGRAEIGGFDGAG